MFFDCASLLLPTCKVRTSVWFTVVLWRRAAAKLERSEFSFLARSLIAQIVCLASSCLELAVIVVGVAPSEHLSLIHI